jgi:hypothetical protein
MAGDLGRVRAAVAAVARKLDRLRIPYMVIGGVAVTVWGEPRLTQDVDVTIATSSNETETIDQLVRAFTSRTSDPAEFVRRQGPKLDRGYMDPIVAELAEALAEPDILAFYKSLW